MALRDSPDSASLTRYVARQPILDARQHVVAYELLFRNSLENSFSGSTIEDASRRVISDAFALFGLDVLTAGKPAFVNFSRGALLEGTAELLSADDVVIELLETIEPDEEVVRACRRLKSRGYRLALDDFEWSEAHEPLLALADIVKVDFLATRGDARSELTRKLRRFDVTLLAEKVETRAEFELGRSEGYAWFQGYFFARPHIVVGRDLPTQHQHHLQILRVVSSPRCNLREVEEVLRRDVALCYKLLRRVNSALLSRTRRIDSIQQALAMLGLDEVRKWVALLTLAGMATGKPAELMRIALVRGRFCEEMAEPFGLKGRSTDLFLAGLFSLIDAMVDRPMRDVLDELPLSADVAEAVRTCAGPLGAPLGCAVAWERGKWPVIDEYAANAEDAGTSLLDAYVRAVDWAHECGEFVK